MKVEDSSIGIKIHCDIANLQNKTTQDINELYLQNLIIVFENQSETLFC